MANKPDDRKHAVNPVLAELQKRLRLDLNNLADNMSEGLMVDWAHYKKTSGLIDGLAIAERHILDLDFQMDVDD
jgi:hypothetical protein